jgi:protein CpxP
MKQYGLLLMMILGVTFFAAAQKIPTASELTTKNMDALSKKVKLNPTQRNIIYNYTLDLYSAQLALSKKQQTGASNEDDITRIYRLQNETTASIRNILKGEQLAQYDAFLDEQMRGGDKKKKKRSKTEETGDAEVVTGISGLTSGARP